MRNKEAEKEANLFAMLLLMPKAFIKKDMEKGIDLGDSKALEELAKKYDVPLTAMAMRIGLFLSKGI